MSFDQVKRTIEEFVRNDRNDFLAIKGTWGVGKTHYWRELIKTLSDGGKVGKNGQIYVSLFGLGDIESVKEVVTASFIEQKLTNKNLLGTATTSNVSRQVQRIAKEIPYLRHLPLQLGATLASLYVREILVCFDDYDRKEDTLTEKQFFGYAAQLKDERNCKIAFIFNSEALPNGHSQFETQNEKVLDRVVTFDPEPNDVFGIAFESDYPFYELVQSACSTLKIRNIRVLKRIRFAIDEVNGYLPDVEASVIEHCIRYLVLFTWSHYDKGSNPPSIETIEAFSFFNRLRPGFSELSDEEKRRVIRETKLLEDYGYDGTDEIGRLIIGYIRNGFLDLTKFQAAVDDKRKRLQNDERKQEYRNIWKEFRVGSYDVEDMFVSRFILALKSNIDTLELYELDPPISLLRQLGKDEDADSFIDAYCRHHQDRFRQYFRRGHTDFSNLKDAYAKETIANLSYEVKEQLSLVEILERIGLNSELEVGQMHYAAGQTTDEYIKAIKVLSGTDTGYYAVKYCLSFGKEVDKTIAQIAKRILGALRQIASESQMSRVRIRWVFNIDLDLTDEEILNSF